MRTPPALWDPAMWRLVGVQTSSSHPTPWLQSGRKEDWTPTPRRCQYRGLSSPVPSELSRNTSGTYGFFLLHFSIRHHWKVAKVSRGVVDNIFSSGYKTAVHFLSSWGSNLEGIYLDSKVSGPSPSSFLPNLLPGFVTGWPACRRRAKPRHQGGVRPWITLLTVVRHVSPSLKLG